jgi:hypothetical protein
MQKTTFFLSKPDAEKLTTRMNAGQEPMLAGKAMLISIGSPDDKDLKLLPASTPKSTLVKWAGAPYKPAEVDSSNWLEVVKLEFNDIDPTHCSDEWTAQWTLFDDDMANKIIDALERQRHTAKVIVAHCEAGISRSAAVSKFAAMYFSFPFPETYMLYNKHVFSTLVRVWRQRLYQDKDTLWT